MNRAATSDGGIDHDGWRVEVLRDLREMQLDCRALAEGVVAAAEGQRGWLQHRSRHAVTYLLPFRSGAHSAEIYIKIYQAPRGLGGLKARLRGSRADNVIRMSAVLPREGFMVPRLLLSGHHPRTGRTMLASLRAEGVALPELLSGAPAGRDPAWLSHKRAVLRELGALVAKLHTKGFIHGDLTPYNVFAIAEEPMRFVLLDHDRTRMAFRLGRQRRQLRNLVQLGRFGFATVTATDRLRVFKSYAAQLGRGRYRSLRKRTARMLAARRRNGKQA